MSGHHGCFSFLTDPERLFQVFPLRMIIIQFQANLKCLFIGLPAVLFQENFRVIHLIAALNIVEQGKRGHVSTVCRFQVGGGTGFRIQCFPCLGLSVHGFKKPVVGKSAAE